MKWLDDLVASVPSDFAPEATEPPEDATELGPLPEDLVPIARTWLYGRQQATERARGGLKDAFGILTDLLTGVKPTFDSEKAMPLLDEVERLSRRERALHALLSAALWEQFPQADEAIGTVFTADGWIVFTAPGDRDEKPRVRFGILERL